MHTRDDVQTSGVFSRHGRALAGLANMLHLLARSAAITCFSGLARLPQAAVGIVPSRRLRRLVSVAALPDLKYGGIFTRASYAPWRGDAAFQRAFAAVRANTLVDEYRCYELWTLCGQLSALEAGDLLEVGVWRGGTGCLMAQQCRNAGRPDRVFLCDTFSGVVKAGRHDGVYVGGEHADTSPAHVSALAARLGLDNVSVLTGVFPDATAHQITDRRFRLCHIDVDVYESAAETFAWVWPRLVPNGIVVFDDYGFYACGGVTRFVDAMRGEPDRLVLYNINGHAVVVKRS